ncbi:MAG: hypothetical protein U0798_10255 [Gemmataceae bacterium]
MSSRFEQGHELEAGEEVDSVRFAFDRIDHEPGIGTINPLATRGTDIAGKGTGECNQSCVFRVRRGIIVERSGQNGVDRPHRRCTELGRFALVGKLASKPNVRLGVIQ